VAIQLDHFVALLASRAPRDDTIIAMKAFLLELKASVLLTAVLVVLLCGAYPLAVWVGAQMLFPAKANGSLVVDQDGTVRGSALLAQNFSSEKYFQPRPSAAGTGYDATSSSGTNLGPTSQKLADSIKAAVTAYRTANDLAADASVPADAVTSSGSGLDPHISVANAELQAPRVARTRGLPLETVRSLIARHTEGRDLGVLGEPGVNVLLLNLALDRGTTAK
jgi:K+-transporting ATPase ATPase C chain